MDSEKKSDFLKHFTVIGAGTIINLLIGVLTTPVITRLVEPSEYGQLSVFNMYTGIMVMVTCVGFDQALVRFFYESSDILYKRLLLRCCIKFPFFICLGIACVLITSTKIKLFQFEFNELIIVLLCINALVQMIYRFSQLTARLSYKSKLYSTLNILQKVLYVTLALVFICFMLGEDFVVLALATVLSYCICTCVSILEQKDIWRFSKDDVWRGYISQKELLKYSFPYIFSMGITTLFQAVDQISLNYFCTYNEVGIYSSAMTLVHIFSVIQTTFNALWMPMAVEHYTQNCDDKGFYQLGNKIITVIMFFIGISLIQFKDIFVILLGEKYREASYILPFLIFNPIMYTISETTVSGLVFMKKSNMQVVVAFGSCIANIIGNIILVPRLGCQGAALSTGISYIIFFSLRTVLSNKYFYIDFNLRKFYILVITVVLYAFYNTFIKFNIGSIIGYVICLGTMFILYRETIVWGISYIRKITERTMNQS